MPSETPVETDTQLVARCLQGQSSAWAVLVGRYQRLVHAIVRRGGLDEHAAADVFQTVFSRLYEHLPRLEQPERLQAWVVTTARRELLRQAGHAKRQVSLTPLAPDDDTAGHWIDQLADESPRAEEQLSALQQLHRLRLGLDRLDERCRSLLALLFADDEERLPYEQLAVRLGMPVGSIGPTRARCLGKLRRLVEDPPA